MSGPFPSAPPGSLWAQLAADLREAAQDNSQDSRSRDRHSTDRGFRSRDRRSRDRCSRSRDPLDRSLAPKIPSIRIPNGSFRTTKPNPRSL